MAVVRFYVDVEVDDVEEILANEERRLEILNEMENVVGKRGYDLYDSGTEEFED